MPRKYHRRHTNSRQYALAKKAVEHALAKQTEVKKFYTNGSLSVLSSGNSAVPLDGIAVGTLSDERIGNNINLLSMNIRMNWQNGDPNNTVRVLCLELYERLGATPVIDLFNTITTPFVGAINSQVNRQLVKRVMYDKTSNLNPQFSGASVFRYKKGYVRFGKQGKKCQYEDGVSDPTNTHIVWVFISDSAAAPSPRCQYAIETRYTDA